MPTAPSSGLHTETAHRRRPGGLYHHRPHDTHGVPDQRGCQITKQTRPGRTQVMTLCHISGLHIIHIYLVYLSYYKSLYVFIQQGRIKLDHKRL